MWGHTCSPHQLQKCPRPLTFLCPLSRHWVCPQMPLGGQDTRAVGQRGWWKMRVARPGQDPAGVKEGQAYAHCSASSKNQVCVGIIY